MSKKLVPAFLIAVFLIISSSVSAKEIKYNVADIPKTLRENARSVVRNQEIVLNIKSISKATVNVTYAITVLNKNGLKDAYFQEFYDKFSKISGVKGRVFDENGVQIKKIPGDEILDYSAISGFSIYEDNRVKYIDPKIRNFPFTVEYSYEESWDGLFSFPSWEPQPYFNLAVEKSSYKATIPKNLTFRFTERNIPSRASVTSDSENNIYYWELQNLKAQEYEPYSVSEEEIFPHVIAAPADFEIDNYKGSLTSWENFGKFISTLNKGKNNLSDDTKKVMNDLVAGITDDYEKIRKIYEYMQGHTRYVSIQVGIGGWQPFDAAMVHRLSYGDCKALTNYMKTMLEAVGIKSNYCLVRAGSTAPSLLSEFPSSQFNHAFLCVPLKSDTIWLECTNQRVPCGFLGDFTDDRDVLLIDDKDGKIVHTKIYSLNDNKEIHTSYLKMDENGKGSAEIHSVFKGLNYDHILPTYLADDTDKKRRISERMKFPGFQIVNFKYTENKAIIPSIEETLNVNFENCLTQLGSRYFLPLNFSNQIKNSPYSMRSRKRGILIRRPSFEADTTVYELPAALRPEHLPQPVLITDKFGKYTAKVEYAGNKIYYTRVYQLYKGQYPASDYNGFVEFFDKIASADAMKCVMIKANSTN